MAKAKKSRGKGERFSEEMSIGDPAFAAWLRGEDSSESETVSPYTVWGLSAVLRSVLVISGTIAGLPLRTYERQGDERTRIPSVFDDPYPGAEGMAPFNWVETILIHLLLWRNAYLWHEDSDGAAVTAYRPIVPDVFTKVERKKGRKLFTFKDPDTKEKQTVGTELITHIPGPSIDGAFGHPLLHAARAIFSAAISGDKAAQTVLRRGIRLAGLVTPEEGESFEPAEGDVILDQLRAKVVGRENAGDIALVNRRLKLDAWTPNNRDSQWHEARGEMLGEVERLFGTPPHLLADTEKQTSWGTGVAEQNLGLARYTLMGWSTRIEQVLTRRLPGNQFVEFDYKGLLQGTPAQEINLLIDQVDAGILDVDEARKILNLPPRSAEQKAAAEGRIPRPRIVPPQALPSRQEIPA
jgi:HK97 family phage portal protein